MRRVRAAAAIWWCVLGLTLAAAQQHGAPATTGQPSGGQRGTASPARSADLFVTSHNCLACHNGLSTSRGEDVSIGTAWRATIMANSSRDPYWQGSVRREAIDHPSALATIEEECSICHMPMAHTTERARGGPARLFDHLRPGGDSALKRLALDGVSCALCHQIQPDRLGTPESFTGGFVVNTTAPLEGRAAFGPYAVAAGRSLIMRSATGFVPTQATHLRQSELCATCHTLYTTAIGPNGEPLGRFPEQVPFLEWQHSAYAPARTCQSCHMPEVEEATRMASVLGEDRRGVSRHTFRGGNFFMTRMLNRYRDELGVEALPDELEREAAGTVDFLAQQAASVSLTSALDGRQVVLDVTVENLTGHKLPTAYPSRRAWLHVQVRDGSGRVIFESGGVGADGAISDNDNDADPSRFEPHYQEIRNGSEVQIYEPILGDVNGRVTTGLLAAVRYLKDNRLPPQGFDKATAGPDIAVTGEAGEDRDFVGGSDHVRYVVDAGDARGPFDVDVELLYQPIGFRWAHNLEPYRAEEPQRFVRYYRDMSAGTFTRLAGASAVVR